MPSYLKPFPNRGGSRGTRREGFLNLKTVMTEAQATHFAQYIKDHDKRFEAKAHPDGDQSTVLLTDAGDGTVLDPVSDIAVYRDTLINQNDPGPTVRAAWDKWQEQAGGG